MGNTATSLEISKGIQLPYGPSVQEEGINFAISSKQANTVALCLFEQPGTPPLHTIPLDPLIHKTGNVWHICVKIPPSIKYYAYQIQSEVVKSDPLPYLLDPYAKAVGTGTAWGDRSSPYLPLGVILEKEEFDWENIESPRIPIENLVIYEMHVRGFTQDESSQVKHPGTFLGVIEKIPHLLELGINAVELMPVQEFNECEYSKENPETKTPLCNYWGYSPLNFFSFMNRYAVSKEPGGVLQEFKTLVKELHRNGIEVILDIVFNHTSEGNEKGPILSYKGIDKAVYYLLDKDGNYQNHTGCGNTFNCNQPTVRELIQDVLRYLVIETQVDGFRFDLASIFTRDTTGNPMAISPLIDELSLDPILAQVKLIAEPWDLGVYQVGAFYPFVDRWSEWNGKYRDMVRNYIKGTGATSKFTTRICGSQDLYPLRSPQASLNFITAHDGFTLYDLVSYNEKKNFANGEDNKDGFDHNDSWNCGEEGPTENEKVNALRQRQMRNFHFSQMISQGLPMVLMGDEYAHTKKGNNNTWCQDDEYSWFMWNKIAENEDFYRFFRLMIKFRLANPILHQRTFLENEDIQWHGLHPLKPNFAEKFVAYTLFDHEKGENLYIAFNPQEGESVVTFPKSFKHWHWIVNTANPPPDDFFEKPKPIESQTYKMGGYSALMLKAI